MAEVNAQHLAQMGIDPATLGSPAPSASPVPEEGRCPSVGPSGRCAASEGHQSSHYRGRTTWRDGEPEPEEP